MAENPESKFHFTDEKIDEVAQKAIDAGKERAGNIPIQETPSSEKEGGTNLQPNVIIKNLRTFQGDVAEAIKNKNLSVTSIALAEDKRRRQRESVEVPSEVARPEKDRRASILERITGTKPTTPKNQPAPQRDVPQPKPVPKIETLVQPMATRPKEKVGKLPKEFVRNSLAVIASVVLVVVGIAAVIFFYMLQKEPPQIAAPTPIDQTIVAFDQKSEIDVTSKNRETLLAEVDKLRREADLSSGEVMYVALTKSGTTTQKISTGELFTLLQTQIPGSTQRAFDKDFMFGFEKLQMTYPFLLIKVSSFDNAYSGMLEWEKTINADIGPIFSIRSVPITTSSDNFSPTSSTTLENGTSTQTKETRVVNFDSPQASGFSDVTFRNKDARILKNSQGETIVLYSFLDRNTLLITSHEEVLRDMVNKYIAGQLIR